MKTFWVKTGALLSLTFALVDASVATAKPKDGFVLTHWGNWTAQQGIDAIEDAARVGTKSVTLMVQMCQPNKSANTLRWCDSPPGTALSDSPQISRILTMLPRIRELGLAINILPFILVDDGSKRHWIWPKSREQWFADYESKLLDVARFAHAIGAHDFIVGSELNLLFIFENRWREIIRNVRRVNPSAHLTASPMFFMMKWVAFWDELDSIGVSAYFPLTLVKRDASTELLTRRWQLYQGLLTHFAQRHSKKITFVEIGYPNTNVAASRPWDYDYDRRRLDFNLPARCWEAFTKVWGSDTTLRGFNIWGLSHVSFDPPKAFNPLHKLSEPFIIDLFNSRAKLR